MPQQNNHPVPGHNFRYQSHSKIRDPDTFDDFIRLATHVCGTSVAIVYLTDDNSNQQWFKSRNTPQSLTAIVLGTLENFPDDNVAIWNPSSDDRFVNASIQFYAGVPAIAADGRIVGVLSVMDSVPRQLSFQQLEGLQALARQLAAQLELRQQLTASNLELSKQQAVLNHNPHPVAICNNEGNIVYINPATSAILQQLGISLFAGFLPAIHQQLVQTCWQRGKRSGPVEVEVGDRVFQWWYQPVKILEFIHLYAVEITAYKRSQAQLLHNALHDSLTGLPNRSFFMQKLRQAVASDNAAHRYREGHLYSLLFLDLDQFKLINNSFGHRTGDQLLRMTARRLQRCVRDGDLVARLGADNFAILLEDTEEISRAIATAESIQRRLSFPFRLQISGFYNGKPTSLLPTFHEVFTTASIGISLSSISYDQPEHLLRDADIALTRAKALGRGCYQVFDTAMHERTVALLQLENDLQRAVKRQEFQVYYQPIIDLDTRRITGFEALVRWKNSEGGFISPAEFIPVAEKTGLILPIGTLVLRQSCAQLQVWQQRFTTYPPLTMSVNISGKQLSDPGFLEQVNQILRATPLEAGSLKLEITESVLMEDAPAAATVLEQLRSQYIQLCIDDFGTGYSSLSYLQRFPVGMLKIDRSFIAQLGVSEENSEIVRAIVMLANNLGLYVTAEGVETEEQLVHLWALECNYAQGYFFSKPLDSERATALLVQSPQW